MATINALYEKLISLNLPKEVPNLIDKTSFAIKHETQNQLLHGFDGTGKKITPKYRNPVYSDVKANVNPLPGFGTPDLRATGSFHKSINIKVYNDSYSIDASDSKTEKLISKYGQNILQLNENSKANYIKGEFTKALQNYITGKTGLKFK